MKSKDQEIISSPKKTKRGPQSTTAKRLTGRGDSVLGKSVVCEPSEGSSGGPLLSDQERARAFAEKLKDLVRSYYPPGNEESIAYAFFQERYNEEEHCGSSVITFGAMGQGKDIVISPSLRVGLITRAYHLVLKSDI